MAWLNKPLKILNSARGRVGTGIFLMASVAYLNDGQFTGKVDWDAAIFFLTALGAWAVSCIPENISTTHDAKLYNEFCDLMDSNTLQMLKNQDFGAFFFTQPLSKIHQIAHHWHGVYYEFENPDIQAKFVPLLQQIAIFSATISVMTHSPDGSPMARLIREGRDENEMRVLAQRVNGDATALHGSIESFIRLARRVLG
jgi:hypothetical protein